MTEHLAHNTTLIVVADHISCRKDMEMYSFVRRKLPNMILWMLSFAFEYDIQTVWTETDDYVGSPTTGFMGLMTVSRFIDLP